MNKKTTLWDEVLANYQSHRDALYVYQRSFLMEYRKREKRKKKNEKRKAGKESTKEKVQNRKNRKQIKSRKK